MTLLPSQRALFEIPDGLAYFNAAYYAPQLNESRRRLMEGVAAKSHPWARTPAHFFEDTETFRRLCAALFGATPDAYAILPSATYGLSTAARILEPRLVPGDEVLVMADEFPSNVLPWRRIAAERGVVIRTIPTPEDGDWTGALLAGFTARTKVATLSTCHWTNGARVDLIPLGTACRERDAALVVDATQSLGAMPFPLEEVQPDFLVAAGYKWLLGPYGLGLMYVAERWRSARPLEESWLARANAEDFTSLADYSDAYMPGARRFDVGEACTPTLLPGALAAFEQIQAWGIPNIADTLAALNGTLAGHLAALGFTLPPLAQRCPHLLGARLPEGFKGNLVAELRKKDVYISQRGPSLRFAPHLYTEDRDVARLVDALQELIKA